MHSRGWGGYVTNTHSKTVLMFCLWHFTRRVLPRALQTSESSVQGAGRPFFTHRSARELDHLSLPGLSLAPLIYKMGLLTALSIIPGTKSSINGIIYNYVIILRASGAVSHLLFIHRHFPDTVFPPKWIAKSCLDK